MKFRTPYSEIPKPAFDYSNPMEDIYIEVPPYSVNTETGDLLNKSPFPIRKKVGQRNIDEIIQSYAYDCDIYKILEKVAISGDNSLLNRKIGTFADYINLPDNLNELNEFCDSIVAKHSTVDKKILQAAINEALNGEALKDVISQYVTEQINLNNGGNDNE